MMQRLFLVACGRIHRGNELEIFEGIPHEEVCRMTMQEILGRTGGNWSHEAERVLKRILRVCKQPCPDKEYAHSLMSLLNRL